MSLDMVCTQSSYNHGMEMSTSEKTKSESIVKRNLFSEILKGDQKKCPYSSLAKDGLIDYNGVVFVCDYKSNSICLGDMSNPKEVLNISLPSGGHLKINVNNLDDIAAAAGMFSPADLCAIMKAISQYTHCVRKVLEVEDEEAQKLEARDLKEEKDWRDMTAEEWDKMIEGIDKYIEAYKERLKEMKELQDEAAQKAASEAEPEMRSLAASSAALAAANGFVSDSNTKEDTSEVVSPEDGVEHEKNWTKTLETHNQTILMEAQEAQKMEYEALSRFQELQLVGSTEAGISSLSEIIECASYKEDENKEKVWTITNIGEEGLTCKKYKEGILLSSWELEYSSVEERQNIEDFISGFKQNENLVFAGEKAFWNEFLIGNITKDNLALTGNSWEWEENSLMAETIKRDYIR
ncbi:MAG: hypothetical protein K6A30_01920 [Lachnospiraceae bacterium]|nr:hypothetical protein [Lachnospiraceae bacterium]